MGLNKELMMLEDSESFGPESTPLLKLPGKRTGDVISPHSAVVTLIKSFLNAGCFSLPYAWKQGGLWVSLGLTFLIAVWNYYGASVLVKASQHLAKKTKKDSLDYGHFTKKVLDYSPYPWLRNNSKVFMYVVNITIIFYQLGMCGVALVFISSNLGKVVYEFTETVLDIKWYISIAIIPILLTNLVAPLRVLSVFAIFSTLFFLAGTSVFFAYCITLPSQWKSLPQSTDLTSTLMFFGITMYAFEGQTMILPIENKLEHPGEFIYNFGVLPTTYSLCTIIMVGIGFYGFTAFGNDVGNPVTLNLPNGPLFVTCNIMLMLGAFLGHCLALYAVLDMLWSGFSRKVRNRFDLSTKSLPFLNAAFRIFWVLVTYIMAMVIPSLDLLVPLVGVTGGTLCALVYPAALQLIHFKNSWKKKLTPWKYRAKVGVCVGMIVSGLIAMIAGLYANVLFIIDYYYGGTNSDSVEIYEPDLQPLEQQ